MKKRWLKLAAIGIMAGTLVVQAPVATYAGENGEAVVQQENGVGSEVATAEHVAKHLENTDEFNMERKDGIAYYSLKGEEYKDYKNCIAAVTLPSDGCEFLFAFDENGYLATDWQQDEDDNWYYFDYAYYFGYTDGAYPIAYGDDFGWYYFDGDGIKQTNMWAEWDNGTWSWFGNDGKRVDNNWAKVSGKWYHFDKEGIMQTGWQKINGKWYYMNTSGAMQTGWQKINGKWYYMNTSGAMQTGWQKINGKWYYMNGSGAMLTGWNKIGGKWYYMNGSEAMLTGWQKIGGKWYYMNGSGAMLTGRQKIGGKWYRFNASGVWIK